MLNFSGRKKTKWYSSWGLFKSFSDSFNILTFILEILKSVLTSVVSLSPFVSQCFSSGVGEESVNKIYGWEIQAPGNFMYIPGLTMFELY